MMPAPVYNRMERGSHKEVGEEADEAAIKSLDGKAATCEDVDDEWDYLTCDSACSRAHRFKSSDTLWLCIYCYDTGFCDNCLSRMTNCPSIRAVQIMGGYRELSIYPRAKCSLVRKEMSG